MIKQGPKHIKACVSTDTRDAEAALQKRGNPGYAYLDLRVAYIPPSTSVCSLSCQKLFLDELLW